MPRQTGGVRRMSGAGYTLLRVNNVEYLKKVVSLVRWLGYPLRKPLPVSFGGGGYMQLGRLILDSDGGGGGTSGEDERSQASMGEGFGGGQVGFALVNAAWLKVYPLVGVGGGGQGITVSPVSAAEPTVGGSYGPYALAGLGVEVRLPLTRRVRPLVGFRAGVRYHPQMSHFGSIQLPPQNRAEPFFYFILGLGIEG